VNGIQIHPDSHLDHGLTDAQRDHVLAQFADKTGFFIATVTLPEGLGTVPCGLHLDVPESEVHYAARGEREYTSRLCNRGTRPVREVTIIAGTDRDNPDDPTVYLFTMFGGPLAPKEPGDPRLTDAERPESEAFWARAALSA
jgi:hypothetical protein